FDVTKTASYTGILTELARRDKDAIRSIHPTKSVVAIGKYAKELTSSHHLSIDPFGPDSPYQKIEKYDAKIIGIGVSTKYLSAIHITDSHIQNEFDTNPYLSKIYNAKCVDYEGKNVIVKTLAHDMNKMNLNIPKFIRENIAKESCKDITYKGMPFFYAETNSFYKALKDLAKKNITVYK
ncbi:MAG: AAC(3) family N-acetyltransferase, partial [Balneolaceae bacterium]|nr:AAC(3) family N-acetyltransferase [Balneolaceae bacterium]